MHDLESIVGAVLSSRSTMAVAFEGFSIRLASGTALSVSYFNLCEKILICESSFSILQRVHSQDEKRRRGEMLAVP